MSKKILSIVLTILVIIGMISVPNGEASAAEVMAPAQGVTVSYRTHVQTYGWQDWRVNGAVSGTQGLAKRLEGIEIKVSGANLGIQYTTHVQTYGWQGWKQNGAMSGTSGQAKRLEAIKIVLTGPDASKYDIYYRVHAQHFGWMNWVKNGAAAGTAGYAYRLEAIQIIITPHNDNGIIRTDVPSKTQQGYISKDGSTDANVNNNNSSTVVPVSDSFGVTYRTHVQTYGWQAWKSNGEMSGTSGQAKRLEGINIRLVNAPYSGGIMYRTHVQTYGWQEWKYNGDMSGTSGKAKRLEGIEIKLNGEMANHYDVVYRTHVQTYGWQAWKKNGEMSGTSGQAKRLEGIEIKLVEKRMNNNSNNQTQTCNHVWVKDKKWIPEVTEQVWVVDQEAYIYQNPIYQKRHVDILFDIDGSSWYYYNDSETANYIETQGGTHYDENGNIAGTFDRSTTYVDAEIVGYEDIEIPEEGHYETKVITEGHYEETGKEYCNICGIVK